MQKEISKKTESDLLLNLKDISKKNTKHTIEDKAITIDKSLEKYNASYVKALEAPIPNINLPYDELLIRAVPTEVKSKGGLILSVDASDLKIADRLNKMSDSVAQRQEILLVGNTVSEKEMEGGIRPGMMCKLKLESFRGIHDRMAPGVIEHEYVMPVEVIDGYKYMIINKRHILYTYEK